MLESYFYLVGSVVLLALVLWSLERRDLERQRNARAATIMAAFFFAFSLFQAWRLARHFRRWDELELFVAAVTIGSLSAATILTAARAWRIARGLGPARPGSE